MKKAASAPYYLKIARDIASRIAAGEFEEGQRIHGRSTMSTEYSTSPETIRRAFKLLADMNVVQVRPQSGAFVLSRANAERCLSKFEDVGSVLKMMQNLQNLKTQYDALNTQLVRTMDEIVRFRYSSPAGDHLPHFEVCVPPGSILIGKSIGQLRFWQKTGATIIAVRRDNNIILSPGPDLSLSGGDSIIFVGTPAAVEAAGRFAAEGGNA